jgi:DnaJ-domain-containing protein 1
MDETLEAELHAFTFGERHAPPKPSAPPELRDALHTLDLPWPVSMDDVKTRYKELAKRHHPDANGGDKASEEILKSVNLAYATLRGKLVHNLAPAPQPAAE